jgi:hypothetical protein
VQPVDDAVEVTESVGLPVAHAEVEWLCVAVGENVEDAVPEALTVGVTVPVSERVPGCEGGMERVVEPVPHWQGDAEGEPLPLADTAAEAVDVGARGVPVALAVAGMEAVTHAVALPEALRWSRRPRRRRPRRLPRNSPTASARSPRRYRKS